MDLRLDGYGRDGWYVLEVEGEIDLATAPRLRERLLSAVNDGELNLVVDLRGVGFIDSTGLGVLIGALKRVRLHEGDLRLVCPERGIRKVFDITGLDHVFALTASVDDAVAAPTA